MRRPGVVARRIASEHNRSLAPEEFARDGDGWLIFDAHGRIVRWQARDAMNHDLGQLVYRVRPRQITQVEVQAWLDARHGR